MASDEDPRRPLINSSTSGGSSNVKYTESLPTTTIAMTPYSIPDKKQKVSKNNNERREKLKRKRSTVKDMFIESMNRRLVSQQKVKEHMSLINDIMCIFALVGIILMITANEILFYELTNTQTVATWSLELIMTITTIILIGLLLYYHWLDLSLRALRNSTNDWRIGLTFNKILLVIVEVIVCAIHPVVRAFPKDSNTTTEQADTLTTTSVVHSLSYVSMDVALGLPMFLRFYLLPRYLLYHSRLTRSAGAQSLCCINQVSINFSFLMKNYLDQWPLSCLSVFLCLFFLIGSWSLRACDYNSDDNENLSILNAMWLFIATITTVGYGDIVPSTYCGRGVATVIVLVGIFVSSLVIAVLAQKLAFTRGEKYLHNFVLSSKLEKRRKEQAASIVRYAMKSWISQESDKPMSRLHHFRYKKQLFESVRAIQAIKQEQRELIDNCIGLPEIAAMQRTTNTNTDDTIQKMENLEFKINTVEEQLIGVKQSIDSIQNTLNILVATVTK